MLTLSEVSRIPFHTSCADYLYDGAACSQPVLSQGEVGLIDNFFVYSIDPDANTVSSPSVAFGIYSDKQQVAYVHTTLPIERKNYPTTYTGVEGDYWTWQDHYEELYSKVRACAFRTDCTPEQIRDVKEYCQCLETIAGSAAWVFYRILNPDFFAWADAL